VKAFFNTYLIISLLLSLFFYGCEKTPSQKTIKELKGIMKQVHNYEYGDSRSWLQKYHDVIAKVHNDINTHEKAELLMIDLLNSDASQQSKLLICKSLGTIGGKASLPALEKLLIKEPTSNMAIIALVNIPLDEVDEILIKVLSNVEGSELIGVINALALRKTENAIEPISHFITNNNPSVSRAAIQAMGAIGGPESTSILYAAFQNSDGQKWEYAEALIKGLEKGSIIDQDEIFNSIYESGPPLSIKTAVLKEIIKINGENDQVDLLLQTLLESDPDFQESLIPLIRTLPSTVSLMPIFNEFSDFSPSIQQKLMLAIADRKDSSIRPYVLLQLKNKNAERRIAALKALKNISKPEDVFILANIASYSNGKERELARECIYWMVGKNADQKIMEGIGKANYQVNSELIKAIGYRKITEAADLVIPQIGSENSVVRIAAIEAIGKIGSENKLSSVISMSLDGVKSAEANIIIEALTSISLNSDNTSSCVEIINRTLVAKSDKFSISILISILGNIGDESTLDYIRPFLYHDDFDVQYTCVKALSDWPDDTPLTDLEKFITITENEKNRQLAMIGIVKLVQKSKKINENEKSEVLIKTFSFTKTNHEKIIVINGISRIKSMLALNFVISQLNNEAIKNSAQEAFIRIAGNLQSSMEVTIISKIDSLAKISTQDEFKERLRILKRSLEL